jgi:hypothetical protein
MGADDKVVPSDQRGFSSIYSWIDFAVSSLLMHPREENDTPQFLADDLRFRAAISQISEVVYFLEDVIGNDTVELLIRLGQHGPPAWSCQGNRPCRWGLYTSAASVPWPKAKVLST